jgi:N-acyl-D-aspartate/D-glutamate deacylase
MSVDLVISGGRVVDGTGAEPVLADVLVAEGRIVDVVAAGTSVDAERMDAADRLVVPGFVDIHTHSDLSRLAYPDAPTRVLQGITTEVIGNCGMSPVPLGSALEEFRTVLGPIDTVPGLPFRWNTIAEYLHALDATPGATNLVPLLGHGSLRYAARGLQPGAAEPAEVLRMESLLTEALEQGFWGMSLGFMYAPGENSDEHELHALLRVLRRFGALLTSHMRAYDRAGLPDAVAEALALARAGDVPLQISHLRSLNDDGSAIERAFELLAAPGVDVEADAYPYLAGHTTLLQLLPAALRSTGVANILEVAAGDPGVLARALRSVQEFDPSAITIARAADGAPEVGHDLGSLETVGEDWAAIAERLLVDSAGNVDVIVVGTRPEDAARVLADPLVSVASDGAALALDHRHNVPHPRSIGTFPRAFRELSDSGLPVGEIVRKMTSKPAARMGLTDRGRIARGLVADVVILDADAVADHATYGSPLTPPSGIHDVLVAGTAVLRDGRPTGARPGRLLRRQG